MKTIVGRAALSPPGRPSAITIGTFDGVHVGHRALISQAQAFADEHDCASVVVTWDRHPAQTLRPDKVPPLLTSPERKLELIDATGVEAVVILEFDDELSRWSPEEFVTRVLVDGLEAAAVFVGQGWRFGHRASGDIEVLRELGGRFGFHAGEVALAEVAGGPASSTRARAALDDGDVVTVRALLARPFDLDGRVLRGDGRGARLGWPTANILPEPGFAHPARGVYAGRARAKGEWLRAAVNVGVNPTFGGDVRSTPVRIEAYLLDYEGDLYDESIRVEFHERLRDERRFDSADALSAQIGRDVDETRRLLPA